MKSSKSDSMVAAIIVTVGVLFCVVLCIAALFGIITGVKAWSRGQARANARNSVTLTHIRIQQAEQQVHVVTALNGVVNARAEQRYLAAVGIKRSQDEINKTLTPQYLQWEALQSQQAIATSGRNNTVIYVPSGQSGVPVITADAGSGK